MEHTHHIKSSTVKTVCPTIRALGNRRRGSGSKSCGAFRRAIVRMSMGGLLPRLRPFGLVLSFFCILYVQVAVAQEPEVTGNSILKENIISIINLPTYNEKLQSRDEFVYILPLGYALDSKMLNFTDIPFSKLLRDPDALGNVYLFARQVNDVLIFKGDSYTQGGTLERFGNQSKLLYSPIHANSFGLIGVMPSPKRISWKKLSKAHQGEIKYTLSLSLGRLSLERGWLDLNSLRNAGLPSGSSIIVGLILTDKLQLSLYREGTLSERHSEDTITIIGFICVVI